MFIPLSLGFVVENVVISKEKCRDYAANLPLWTPPINRAACINQTLKFDDYPIALVVKNLWMERVLLEFSILRV